MDLLIWRKLIRGGDPNDPNAMPSWLPENFSFLPGELREGDISGATVGKIEFEGLGSAVGFGLNWSTMAMGLSWITGVSKLMKWAEYWLLSPFH